MRFIYVPERNILASKVIPTFIHLLSTYFIYICTSILEISIKNTYMAPFFQAKHALSWQER